MGCDSCGSGKVKKNGKFYTELHTIQKYKCLKCNAYMTEEIEDKHAKKPHIRDQIKTLYAKNVPKREIARKLGCSRTTVKRHLRDEAEIPLD